MIWPVLVCICVIILYFSYYYRYPKKTSILQTSLNQFAFGILLEKQPVVIDNKDCDLAEMKNAWFKINPSQTFSLNDSDMWHTNRYKYALIHASSANTEVLLVNPNKKLGPDGEPQEGENVVAIQLSRGQLLILPFKWHYIIPKNNSQAINCEALGVHDFVTYFLP